MHPSIQQRIEGLDALRLRAAMATTEFYNLVGKESPVQLIRYQVIARGTGMYHLKEIETGKTVGFRDTWVKASNYAQHLERRAYAQRLIQGSGFES